MQILYNKDVELAHFPFVNMQEIPELQSKIVSQALFGEQIRIRNKRGDWAFIETSDGYAGWVQKESYVTLKDSYPAHLKITRLRAHLYAEADTVFAPLLTLPYGSPLHLLDASDPRWAKILLPDGRGAYIQKGDVESDETLDLFSFAKQFLGLPYTWGGRSSFGYDCSGYVQMLYAREGILLPRDARQQAVDPRGQPTPFDLVRMGDLIFWGKSEIDIGHVGMIMEENTFIHTSTRENKPYLRMSRLNDPEWNGSKENFYPFRSARRFALSRKNPKEK